MYLSYRDISVFTGLLHSLGIGKSVSSGREEVGHAERTHVGHDHRRRRRDVSRVNLDYIFSKYLY